MATVKIQTAPCEGNPTGVVIIEECDYDPTKHTLWTPEPPVKLGETKEAPTSTGEFGKKRRG